MAFAVRDFALVTLVGELSATFPGQLVFTGGFVLRHAHGHLRFSKDVDATRHAPPSHKLEADDVAATIRDASIQNVVQFVPGEPATDSARSLVEAAPVRPVPRGRRHRLAANQGTRAVASGAERRPVSSSTGCVQPSQNGHDFNSGPARQGPLY
jgi:hypothetical protein